MKFSFSLFKIKKGRQKEKSKNQKHLSPGDLVMDGIYGVSFLLLVLIMLSAYLFYLVRFVKPEHVVLSSKVRALSATELDEVIRALDMQEEKFNLVLAATDTPFLMNASTTSLPLIQF